MKYNSLRPEEKEAVDNVMRIFKIGQLIHLDKVQIGEAVARYVDAAGQDGKAFVHHVYEESTNPLTKTNPPLWLLCSFLTTTLRAALRKFGRIEDQSEFFELAQDAIEIAADQLRL